MNQQVLSSVPEEADHDLITRVTHLDSGISINMSVDGDKCMYSFSDDPESHESSLSELASDFPNKFAYIDAIAWRLLRRHVESVKSQA